MRGRGALLTLSLCAATLLGCKTAPTARDAPEGVGGGPPVAENPAPSVREGVARLESNTPITALELEHHKPALVSLPTGATTKRPILVAAHGRDDYPRPLCEMWRGIVGDRAFVVCPTGVPSEDRAGAFTYASHDALSKEIEDAVEALRAKYPEHADPGPLVYSGFSLGSYQGVRVVSKDPSTTPRVILIEGGHDPWNEDLIETFADGGGQRVLFVTGQATNQTRSERVARELRGAGIASRVVHADGAGHVYTGEVRARIAEAFDWVVEGDDRWKK